jgi:hypothetical protein
MHTGEYVFSQVMGCVSRYDFNRCAARYGGGRRVRSLTCREQFLAMAFGQLCFRESLRDVVTCLGAHREKLYHLGFRSEPRRSTLADANERRDWRVFRDYAELLIGEAKALYAAAGDSLPDIDGAAYAVDSTTISLCLKLFQWARFDGESASVKLHLGLRLGCNIPAFFSISEGTRHDVRFLDSVSPEAGARYVMDRGYVDFARFGRIHCAGAFFVTRAKAGMRFSRAVSRPCDRAAGVVCDQEIRLTGATTSKAYPDRLRRIKYRDAETRKTYVFITNDMEADALTVAALYRSRWQVELFFKWIKQHLAVKSLWGRSENAVRAQICVALCTFLIVAIAKRRLGIERESYEIMQILSVSLFDKTPLVELFSRRPAKVEIGENENTAQLRCF